MDPGALLSASELSSHLSNQPCTATVAGWPRFVTRYCRFIAKWKVLVLMGWLVLFFVGGFFTPSFLGNTTNEVTLQPISLGPCALCLRVVCAMQLCTGCSVGVRMAFRSYSGRPWQSPITNAQFDPPKGAPSAKAEELYEVSSIAAGICSLGSADDL
jgi:hypothetical protein